MAESGFGLFQTYYFSRQPGSRKGGPYTFSVDYQPK